MTKKITTFSPIILRNFIFGVEDSLVSTVGLLSGIALTDLSANTILLTGTVLIFVEAFSMAAGSFLSEHSAEEYREQKKMPLGVSLASGSIMFFSYFISGFIPLFPYIIFPVSTALGVSIALSLLTLFILGIFGARISRTGLFRGGFRMLVIGGIAIAIGVVVGKLVGQI
jgi:VIT1/CCC1 family predicted Fe2+/Mn2+ transporter